MAGSRPRASSEDIGTADKISSVTAKASHKKRKKAKKSKVQQAAVLADADHAPVQPPPEPPQVGNKDEAQLIRQRLGIKAEDAKSSQTRVGFQFSFSVAEACPDAQASDDDHHGGAAFQTNIQTEPTSVAEAPKITKSKNDKKKRLSMSLPGLPARDAQASSPLQPDESGFIPRRVFIGGMPFWYSEEEIRQCWLECGEISDFTMLTFPDTGNFRGIVFITFAAQEGFDAALKFDGDELDGKRLVVQRCKAPAQARRATVRDGNPNWEQSTPHAGRDHDAVECSPRGNGVTSGARGVEDRPGKKRHRRDMHLQVSEADASGEKSSDDAGQRKDKLQKSHHAPPQRVKGYNVLFVGNIPWELSRTAVTELFEAFKPKFVRMFDKAGIRQHKGFAHIHFADEEAVDKAMSMNGASVMGRKLKVMYAQPSRATSSQPSAAEKFKDVIEEGI